MGCFERIAGKDCRYQSVHWTLGTARRACRIFEHFSGFGFFLLPSIVHTRPHAGNAHRWAHSIIVECTQ